MDISCLIITYFNSRPHEEVDQDTRLKRCFNHIFQLTTSRGGRHNLVMFSDRANNFNSRPHEEVDRYDNRSCNWRSDFNSRPHEEVDSFFDNLSIALNHFNSRPHEEVDSICHPFLCIPYISTHDLTRRSTIKGILPDKLTVFQLTTSRGGRQQLGLIERIFEYISTHDLTRRSTQQVATLGAEVTFQLTTSRGGRLFHTFLSKAY